jgi:hypothetical protein
MNIKDILNIKLSKRVTFRTGLVVRPQLIWKGSIFILVILLLTVLVFDGYTFLFRINNLEQESTSDVVGQKESLGINREFVNKAKTIINRRQQASTTAGDNLPAKSPFGQ